MAGGASAETDRPGWTWNWAGHFVESHVGWMTLVHGGAIAATWGMTVSDIDADVQQWSAGRDEGWSIALSLPGLVGGYLVPVGIPLWMKFRGRSERTRIAGDAVLQAVSIAVVSGNLLKAISGRQDPRYFLPDEAEERSRDFKVGFARRGIYNGWPSGHAITNTAVAAAIANVYHDAPRVRTIAYGWAAYVMMSATFGFQGDVHWASDVVAGGMMGWAIGRTVGRSFREAGDRREGSAFRFVGLPGRVSLIAEF